MMIADGRWVPRKLTLSSDGIARVYQDKKSKKGFLFLFID